MSAAQAAFGIAGALHTAFENDRAKRAAIRQGMLDDMSQANTTAAVLRLGRQLAESRQSEAALREELAAMRLRALRAEGALMRLARQ